MEASEIERETSTSQPIHRAPKRAVWLITALVLPLSLSPCFAERGPANDLARLVPSDAPVLAGLRQMPDDSPKDVLWLATRNNREDLRGFIALTAGDTSRRIEQVMVAAWASPENRFGNHLLLAQGQFRLESVSQAEPAATTTDYKDVRVIELPSADGTKPSARWLAIMRPTIAVYGTPAAVRYAVDHHLTNAPLNAQMQERLDHAYVHDAAWSSIRLDSHQLLTPISFPNEGDSGLRCLAGIHELELGIRIGRQVAVELRARPVEGRSEAVSMQCLATAFFEQASPTAQLAATGYDASHVRVALSRESYDRWLNSFRNSRAGQTLLAMISGPGF